MSIKLGRGNRGAGRPAADIARAFGGKRRSPTSTSGNFGMRKGDIRVERGTERMPQAPGNFGIGAKKSLGQHFLKNPKVVEKIVATARLKPGDIVLEIGPGTGALTEGLLGAGACVIAVEADARAIETLNERFAEAIDAGQLLLHHADVREATLESFIPKGPPYAIVANIPYYLSGMLIRAALSADHQPEKVVFLVQKEVAERIVYGGKKGKGGNAAGARQHRHRVKESLLSLSVKIYGRPRYVATVTKGNFSPAPKVDSAILAIECISRKHFKKLTEKQFFDILHAGFSSRRKQLLGNLATLCDKKILMRRFETLGIPAHARGEDLSVATWLALAETMAHCAQSLP